MPVFSRELLVKPAVNREGYCFVEGVAYSFEQLWRIVAILVLIRLYLKL